jgi:polyhydroxyalkanoate synthesis regulator phasin
MTVLEACEKVNHKYGQEICQVASEAALKQRIDELEKIVKDLSKRLDYLENNQWQ